MQTEFEVKVLGIDIAETKKKLLTLGFASPKILSYRRYVYEIDHSPDAWLRLRTDGPATTLTYKRFIKDSVDGVQELEIVVDDLEATHELLTTLGYGSKIYQENRRTLFVGKGVEIAIDEWPKIKPYVEIEAKDQKTVDLYIKKLGFEKAPKTSQPTSYVYELAGLSIYDYKKLVF